MHREREAIEDDARAQRFHPVTLSLEVLLDLRELEIERQQRIKDADFEGQVQKLMERAEKLLLPPSFPIGPTSEQEAVAHPIPFLLPPDFEIRNPSEILAEISSLLQTGLEANAQFQQQALELLTGIHHQLSLAPDTQASLLTS